MIKLCREIKAKMPRLPRNESDVLEQWENGKIRHESLRSCTSRSRSRPGFSSPVTMINKRAMATAARLREKGRFCKRKIENENVESRAKDSKQKRAKNSKKTANRNVNTQVADQVADSNGKIVDSGTIKVTGQTNKKGDGINISVEEELDYDFPDEEANALSTICDGESSDESMEAEKEDAEVMCRKVIPSQTDVDVESANELLKKNPGLQGLLNKLVEEKVKKALQMGEGSKSTVNSSHVENRGKMNLAGAGNSNNIKSPLDTTIYAPALALRTGPLDNSTGPMRQIGMCRTPERLNFGQNSNSGIVETSNPANIADKISNFVESVRLETTPNNVQEETVPGLQQASRRVEQMIVKAEKFKAAIAEPPGMNWGQGYAIAAHNDSVVLAPGAQGNLNFQAGDQQLKLNETIDRNRGNSDDDFFHLVCHIDSALQVKIENGEYVDLDKLLPKDKSNPQAYFTDFERLEWVHNETGTFLAPAKKQNKINSFRKWEQAFRVYATIYCSKNPTRSKEIWQYITTINTAANAYVWDNVYNYDIIFHQLMQFNPQRSWAVTYNQMWNLSMKEPLQRNSNGGSWFSQAGGSGIGRQSNKAGLSTFGQCKKPEMQIH